MKRFLLTATAVALMGVSTAEAGVFKRKARCGTAMASVATCQSPAPSAAYPYAPPLYPMPLQPAPIQPTPQAPPKLPPAPVQPVSPQPDGTNISVPPDTAGPNPHQPGTAEYHWWEFWKLRRGQQIAPAPAF